MAGVLTEADAKKAKDAQQRSGGTLRDTLVAMGPAGEDQIAQAIATPTGLAASSASPRWRSPPPHRSHPPGARQEAHISSR